jgi:hypothetical protein
MLKKQATLNDPCTTGVPWPFGSVFFKPSANLHVSSIFKWYSEDCNDDIVGFFKQYAKGGLKERLGQHKGDMEVEYLDYDWSLNGK